jgi:hypothetical protein
VDRARGGLVVEDCVHQMGKLGVLHFMSADSL